MPLNSSMVPRREQLLELVVERFIEQKRPVPSFDLAEPLGVSSATVRNDLAVLEEMGLLRQPHTSSGRVPTREAYRTYAHKFIPPKRLSDAAMVRLERTLGPVSGEQRFRVAVMLAASLSGYATVMSFAPREARVEAIILSLITEARVLVVVILEGGVARELILEPGFRLERDVLERLEQAFRQTALGAHEVPAKLLALERQASPAVSSLARSLRERWGEVAPHTSFSSGATPVLDEPESGDAGFLRSVLELLERPNNPSGLTPGLSLHVDDPDGISSITVAFKSNAGHASVSILGPTRMRYPQAISVAKAVADALA
jgi:heat-inducible transcriptional repressor